MTQTIRETIGISELRNPPDNRFHPRFVVMQNIQRRRFKSRQNAQHRHP